MVFPRLGRRLGGSVTLPRSNGMSRLVEATHDGALRPVATLAKARVPLTGFQGVEIGTFRCVRNKHINVGQSFNPDEIFNVRRTTASRRIRLKQLRDLK